MVRDSDQSLQSNQRLSYPHGGLGLWLRIHAERPAKTLEVVARRTCPFVCFVVPWLEGSNQDSINPNTLASSQRPSWMSNLNILVKDLATVFILLKSPGVRCSDDSVWTHGYLDNCFVVFVFVWHDSCDLGKKWRHRCFPVGNYVSNTVVIDKQELWTIA